MIITFDLGTTRLKVAAFDLEGDLIGQVAIRNVDYQDGTYKWQSADDWWRNCVNGFHKLIKEKNLGTAAIKGFSLSGRAGAAVFVDKEGEVLAQPWSDTRHVAELKQLLRSHIMPLYAATLMAKYQWMAINKPEIIKRTRHILYAKDFLLYRLAGVSVTDPASGPDGLTWPDSDVPESVLPLSQLPWNIAGELKAMAADSLQCQVGIPVAVGAHDGICANTGAGAINQNQIAITLGTHAVVRAISSTYPKGSLRFYGYPGNKHVIGGNALMAGRSLDWFIDNWVSSSEDNRHEIFSELDRAASIIDPGSGGLKFLPYLSGQLAPERRPGATATFHGLTINHNRDEMFRSVLEGSGFALCRVFNQVIDWTGEPVSIGVTGSGVLGRTWTQLIADTLQRPLSITDASSEGRGAAMFCAVALGLYKDIDEASLAMVHISHTIEPDPSLASIYDELLGSWTHLSSSIGELDKVRT
jgi:sugar (pentulose or hexulose) kinase